MGRDRQCKKASAYRQAKLQRYDLVPVVNEQLQSVPLAPPVPSLQVVADTMQEEGRNKRFGGNGPAIPRAMCLVSAPRVNRNKSHPEVLRPRSRQSQHSFDKAGDFP